MGSEWRLNLKIGKPNSSLISLSAPAEKGGGCGYVDIARVEKKGRETMGVGGWRERDREGKTQTEGGRGEISTMLSVRDMSGILMANEGPITRAR